MKLVFIGMVCLLQAKVTIYFLTKSGTFDILSRFSQHSKILLIFKKICGKKFNKSIFRRFWSCLKKGHENFWKRDIFPKTGTVVKNLADGQPNCN